MRKVWLHSRVQPVPALIMTRNGLETGRLVEPSVVSLEKDPIDLLK